MYMYLFLSIYVSLAFAMQYLKDISMPEYDFAPQTNICENILSEN